MIAAGYLQAAILFVFMILVAPQGYAREIRTGNVQLDPPDIDEIVDLSLMAAPSTTIPSDGSIEYIFPLGMTELPRETDKGCVLEVPPQILSVTCTYSKTSTEPEQIRVIADNFKLNQAPVAIETDSFFSLRLPGVRSPRSTAETDSFEFASYDAEGNVLDFQKKGLVAKASEYHQIQTVSFVSTNQIVGAANANLEVTFTTTDELIGTDQIWIQIPKWNQEANFPLPMITYIDEELSCIGGLNTKEIITCTMQRGFMTDTIILYSPLINTVADPEDTEVDRFIIESGSQISFQVGPIFNPISAAPVSGFRIETLSSNQGKIGNIAVGYGTLSVSEPAEVSNVGDKVSLVASESLINQKSDFILEIELPLPLNQGCQVDLYIPRPLFIGPDLTSVTIGGMFGSKRQAFFSLDTTRNLIKIDQACLNYRSNVVKAQIELRQFVNPGYVITSESFYIEIFDVNGNKVVQTSGGMTFSTTPGTMFAQDLQWFAANRLVSAYSEISFAIQPANPSKTGDIQIKLTLPAEDFEELPSPCEMVYQNPLVNDETSTCETDVDTNTFILSNLLNRGYSFDEFAWIEFSIDAIKMPSSSRPTGQYYIEYLDNIDGVYRLVDTVTVTNKLSSLPGGLSEVSVEPLLATTYTEDTMSFSFILGHIMLQNGFLTIKLPPELKFVNTPDCLAFSSGIDQDGSCAFEKDLEDQYTGLFTLQQGFKSAQYDQLAEPLVIQVSSIFTPRSVTPTTNFELKTYDQNAFLIDTHSSYILAALTDAERIKEVRVVQNIAVVGQSTVYDFLMKSPYPLYAGDLLTLTIPAQAAKKLSKTYKSIRGSDEQIYLKESLHGSLVGLDSIAVTLAFKESLTEIPIGAEFGFQISFLENPESTRPSDPFHVIINNQEEDLVVKIVEDQQILVDKKFLMEATQPAQMIFGMIDNEGKHALEPTLIEMRLDTRHTLPANSKVQISVPEQLGLPESDDGLSCWIDSSPFGDVECTFDRDTLTFVLLDINPHGMLRGGSSLQIQLKGFFNRNVAAPTDTFTAMTMTKDGYLIDELLTGMPVAALCDWPCWECPAGQPSKCLKCDTRLDSLLPLFFDGTCRNDCPSNYYEINGICSQCDAGCLECDQTSKKCLECHFGMYLLGNKCMDVCPDTHFGIDSTKSCELCDSPCKTCEGSQTTCTSCDLTQPFSYFFQNECFESCPIDISVEDEGVCEECNVNCKTCHSDYSADYCTSCYGDQFLSNVTHTCVETCPAEISVARTNSINEKNQVRTCDLCNDNCLTCTADDPDICLECREGLKMIETTKECVQACPLKTAEVWLALTQDTICAECAPGCLECENSREHCTVCEADFFFADFSCVKTCPAGFMAKSVDDHTCVLERDVCPFGQAYNDAGECELTLAECEVGYVLNRDQTECIPEPGFHLPFAFLYGAIGWSIYILRNSNRDKFPRENIISQLLIGFTFLQQFSYMFQIIIAYTMDISFVGGMHTFAYFILYLLNLVCLFAIHRLMKDKPFEHWRDQYTRENQIIVTVSTLYSFKATRMLYCNMMSKPYFDAACENRFRSLLRPFFLLTGCSLVQTGTILIANVYTIWLLRWGYEIVTLSISSIILGIIVFFLEVYEFVLYKQHEPDYLGVGDYFNGQQKPSHNKNRKSADWERMRKAQVRVMSVMENGENGAVREADNIPPSEESIMDFSSVPGNRSNMSQKILLGQSQKQQLSDKKPSLEAATLGDKKPKEEKFQFENIQMGKKIKIDEQRVDFGEQGQAQTLQAMIKKLDEHQKIKRIRNDLDQVIAQEQAVYDGKEIPHSSDEEVDENGVTTEKKPAVVDKYLDEDMRKQLLIQSSKHKNRQFRQKRQFFEKHRVEQPYDMNNNDQRDYHSDFEDRYKTDTKSINPLKVEKKTLKSMITTVALGPKEQGAPGYIEELQCCSEGELERDKLLYDHFYVKFKKQFDEKARKGELVPNAKLHQSFDGDVLREMYDDFGVCSDFESELSWISYPPDKGFLKDYYENNPVKQAENELFKQKIKIKFQYNNMYKESYANPPRPKLNLKPSVKTQTVASDVQPEQITLQAKTDDENGRIEQVVRTIDLNFDPFESEEEFVIEESEQFSAIDDAMFGDLVDKVIHEGFSDYDSDIQAALETNLDIQETQIQETADEPSQDYITKHKLKQKQSKQFNAGVSKKRKRSDTQADFNEKQNMIKYEAQAARVGLIGRATDINVDKTDGNGGKLGDVYDAEGHLVYDKDYISQIDDADGVSSIAKGSQLTGRSKGSNISKGSKKSAKSKVSKKSRSPAASKSASKHASNEEYSNNRKNSMLGVGGHSYHPSVAGSNVDLQDPQRDVIVAHPKLNELPQDQVYPPVGANITDFQNVIFQDHFSDNENSPDKNLSVRERQMVKAYATNNSHIEDKILYTKQSRRQSTNQGPPSPKKSSSNKSGTRKRKRSDHFSPQSESLGATQQRFVGTGNGIINNQSNRGLIDAQSQIQLEESTRDNGILQLVIQNNPSAIIEQQTPFGVSQLKPDQIDKRGGENSEFGEAIGDHETRGGNLSSSAHDHSSNQNLHAGYGTASMNLHGTQEAVTVQTQGNSSAVKAHHFLNNPQWESDASNSQMYQQFSGLQARKMPPNCLDSPQEEAAIRTDGEQNLRRRDLNQTEVGGAPGAYVRNENDNPQELVHQQLNWSDDGAQQQRSHTLYDRRDRYDTHGNRITEVNDQDEDLFGNLGQSYAHNRKMTGPQPFMSLGVQSKPYKARRKRKNDQLEADQRRAKFSMGSDRMVKLENIYIKNGLAQTGNRNAQLPPRNSSIPRADSLANETAAVFRRHGKKIDTGSQYKNSAQTTSKVNRRNNGPRLHKQNFVEDGQNIISGRLFKQSSVQQDSMLLSTDQQLPRVKRELHLQPQLSKSAASSNTDLQILKQLDPSQQDAYQQNQLIFQPQGHPPQPSRDSSAYY